MVRCQDKKKMYLSRKEAEESIKRLLIEEAYKNVVKRRRIQGYK